MGKGGKLQPVNLMTGRDRLPVLTSVRFFAAIYVVFFHYAKPFVASNLILNTIVQYGYVGVSFFFVLSGFILTYNYLADPGKPVNKRRFWIARFARIYPVYILAFLLALAVQTPSLQLHSLKDTARLMATMVSEAGLGQAWTPWTSCVINCPAWSVSTEAFFYLLFPFLGAWLVQRSNPQLRNLIIVLFALLLLPAVLYFLLAQAAPGADTVDRLLTLLAYTPIVHLPQFLIGSIAGLIYLRGREKQAFVRRGKWMGVLAFLVFILMIASLFLLQALSRSYTMTKAFFLLFNSGLLSLGFAYLIIYLAAAKNPLMDFLSHPALVLLGDASYGIYILQNPLGYLAFFLLYGSIDHSQFSSLSGFWLYLGTLVLLSVVIYRVYETRARRWINEQASTLWNFLTA